MRVLIVIGLAALFQLAIAVGSAAAATPTCAGDKATIVGTSRADVLRGTPRKDVIVGLGGNDLVIGLGGADVICGGAGNDDINAGGGGDLLLGGSGSDRILGGDGDDIGSGESGNDELLGGPGNDNALSGGSGSDRLVGGSGSDALVGDSGPDRLVLGPDDDFGFGGLGNDVLIGGAGNDRLHGDEGVDSLAGDEGADFCVGEQKTSCEPLEAGGDLPAGTYLFNGFQPSVTLTIGDGWWSEAELSYPSFVQLAQGSSSVVEAIGITHVPEEVYDPATSELVPLEGDFLEWLTSQDCIDVSAGPIPASIAGATGVQIDFSVGTEPACFERFLWWPSWNFFPGERYRFYMVDVNGVDLIVYIYTTNAAEFDAFLPDAEAVLSTLQFG